jgi:hypothetical protein
LTVNTAGTTTFGGSIGLGVDGIYGTGDDNRLGALTTDPTGGTTISAGVLFSTAFTFNDTVTLSGSATIQGSGAHKFLASTAILGGGNSLTLSGSGTTTIGGNVSGLFSLVRDGGGTTAFGVGSAVSVTTTGTGNFQVYKDTITLTQNATLTGSSVTSFTTAIPNNPGSNSNFGGSVKTLTVNITP